MLLQTKPASNIGTIPNLELQFVQKEFQCGVSCFVSQCPAFHWEDLNRKGYFTLADAAIIRAHILVLLLQVMRSHSNNHLRVGVCIDWDQLWYSILCSGQKIEARQRKRINLIVVNKWRDSGNWMATYIGCRQIGWHLVVLETWLPTIFLEMYSWRHILADIFLGNIPILGYFIFLKDKQIVVGYIMHFHCCFW